MSEIKFNPLMVRDLPEGSFEPFRVNPDYLSVYIQGQTTEHLKAWIQNVGDDPESVEGSTSTEREN